MRWLAVAPHPPGRVQFGEQGLQLFQNPLYSTAGGSWWLQSSCGKQGEVSDSFEDEIAIPVFGELPKNLGDGQTSFAQFAQDLGLVLDECVAVSSVPVCFAMPPSFFDYDPTHGQNGKIDCFVNTPFPALSFRLEDEKFAADQPAPFRIIRARFLKGIFQPARNGLPRRPFVPIALSACSVDESGRAFERTTEGAISIVDQALLAVSRVKRDARTRQPTCRAVKFARQFQGFASRAGINGQEFSNLRKITKARILRLQQFQSARNLKKGVVPAQDRFGPCEDSCGREDGRRHVKLPALRRVVSTSGPGIGPIPVGERQVFYTREPTQ